MSEKHLFLFVIYSQLRITLLRAVEQIRYKSVITDLDSPSYKRSAFFLGFAYQISWIFQTPKHPQSSLVQLLAEWINDHNEWRKEKALAMMVISSCLETNSILCLICETEHQRGLLATACMRKDF